MPKRRLQDVVDHIREGHPLRRKYSQVSKRATKSYVTTPQRESTSDLLPTRGVSRRRRQAQTLETNQTADSKLKRHLHQSPSSEHPTSLDYSLYGRELLDNPDIPQNTTPTHKQVSADPKYARVENLLVGRQSLPSFSQTFPEFSGVSFLGPAVPSSSILPQGPFSRNASASAEADPTHAEIPIFERAKETRNILSSSSLLLQAQSYITGIVYSDTEDNEKGWI